MAAHAHLDITTGVVRAIQHASESAPPGLPRRPGARLADELVNILRLTLEDRDGGRHEFEFRNTTVGVREGQTVAVVRAKRSAGKAAIPLMLVNQSNGQRDEFPDGLRRAASQKGLPARWKALLGAAAIALLTYVVTYYVTFSGLHRGTAAALALGIGAAAFVGLWGLIALSDQIRLPAKDREEVARLRKEVHAALFAPPPGAPGQATPPALQHAAKHPH